MWLCLHVHEYKRAWFYIEALWPHICTIAKLKHTHIFTYTYKTYLYLRTHHRYNTNDTTTTNRLPASFFGLFMKWKILFSIWTSLHMLQQLRSPYAIKANFCYLMVVVAEVRNNEFVRHFMSCHKSIFNNFLLNFFLLLLFFRFG